MAGNKLFRNISPYELKVTLLIRRSEDPRDLAGTKEFSLPPNGVGWQSYGNDIDIYLNGIRLATVIDGSLHSQADIVLIRGSRLDDEFNRFNAVDFNYGNGSYFITTRQVS